ncbi:MAG: peptidase M28 family protein, partial [Bacteroidia bacterium]|nr:peptidase M28 family protein [Bacteroidia bacterium]
DVGRLKDQGTGLIGIQPDTQRYFDHHHAASDNIDAVNKRELELGSASITSLVYLLSKYGFGIEP